MWGVPTNQKRNYIGGGGGGGGGAQAGGSQVKAEAAEAEMLKVETTASGQLMVTVPVKLS